MKTVQMLRSFDYQPDPRVTIRFDAGITYRRVIEAAASAIIAAGAGRIVIDPFDASGSIIQDASHVWTIKRRRRLPFTRDVR